MAVTKEILTLAVETGDALLRNGAEVYRVEDTVLHILKAYEITDCDVYVLSNGIFASANENKEDACSMIRHVPLGSTHLGRIAALNQLSREICSHECSLRDAWVRLEECKSIPKNKNWVEIFFCGVGSAGFCYLFGGTALDSFVAFFIGQTRRIQESQRMGCSYRKLFQRKAGPTHECRRYTLFKDRKECCRDRPPCDTW